MLKRQDFIHKLTYNLVKNNSIILVEDLKLMNLTKSAKGNAQSHGKNVSQKSGLNRVILDLGISEFYRQLIYKCNWYGRTLIKVDPKYTSQECSNCGHTCKENRRTQEIFECVKCGHKDHADLDASIVIFRRGLAICLEREALACA